MKRLWVVASALLVAWACSESPVESVMGPQAATIDSAAWKQRMAHRPAGLMFSESMTDCNAGACTFTPTDYHCGGTKVECSLQIADIITTPTTMTPKTVMVSGSGALLCNSTMGRVVAYGAADEVLGSFDLKPIDPGDCGEDNITFGGTTTFSIDAGVKYIIIEAPSPLTFPVSGGGTGIMSARYKVQINDEAIPVSVSCPATATRSSIITCTATLLDSTAAVTGWQWVADSGGQVIVRSTNVNSLTWAGEIVAPGWVEVTANVNGHPFPLPALSNDMTVQPRNWSALNAQSAVALISPNPLPPFPKDSVGVLGRTQTLPFVSPLTQITDNGPNHLFAYYSTMPMRVEHQIWINVSMNPGQPFYNLQDAVPGKTQSGPHGLKYRWCWQSRVPLLQDIIEAHEGTQQETWSHVGVFNRVLDSLLRVEGERVATTSGAPPAGLFESIARRAHTADSLYDYDLTNNVYRIDPAAQVIFPQDTIRCRFRYFP